MTSPCTISNMSRLLPGDDVLYCGRNRPISSHRPARYLTPPRGTTNEPRHSEQLDAPRAGITATCTLVPMSQRLSPPFRADHVGSFLRPANLLAARADFAEGRLDADGLYAVEDAAIRDVVALQEDLGLQSATDGEFRRTCVAHGLYLRTRWHHPH
jgi:hypothetical protein